MVERRGGWKGSFILKMLKITSQRRSGCLAGRPYVTPLRQAMIVDLPARYLGSLGIQMTGSQMGHLVIIPCCAPILPFLPVGPVAHLGTDSQRPPPRFSVHTALALSSSFSFPVSYSRNATKQQHEGHGGEACFAHFSGGWLSNFSRCRCRCRLRINHRNTFVETSSSTPSFSPINRYSIAYPNYTARLSDFRSTATSRLFPPIPDSGLLDSSTDSTRRPSHSNKPRQEYEQRHNLLPNLTHLDYFVFLFRDDSPSCRTCRGRELTPSRQIPSSSLSRPRPVASLFAFFFFFSLPDPTTPTKPSPNDA